MASHFTSESRAERVIAGGRVVLAASSLFAVWLDPTEPAKFATVAYGLLAAYLVYALAIALWVTQTPALPGAQRWLSHGFDLAFFSAFTYFTSGPASPFIAYFVFSLVCGTLRWRWRGAFWTALVALAAFLGVSLYFAEVLRDPAFQLTPFIVRAVYLVVFAVLLGYLGAHEERSRREMAMLADWAPSEAKTVVEAERELLDNATRVVGAPRALAAWSDDEEPWLYVASFERDGGLFSRTRESAATLDPPVDGALAGASFLVPDPERQPRVALARTAGRIRRVSAPSIHPALVARLGRGPLLAVPLAGELHRGWLLFAGKPVLTGDDLVLGDVVGGLVAARLDHAFLIEELRTAAAAQERVRLARDLHDGVLQSFTGIGLRVAAARRLADPSDEAVSTQLGDLQQLLAREQRDLRFLIRELESPALASADDAADLPRRLGELAEQIEETWGIDVDLRLGEPPPRPAGSVGREVYAMVREGVVNAVRHGGAKRVAVEVDAAADGSLGVRIVDDGCGFPFHGRFGLAELEADDRGPRSLRARLGELGGDLVLETGEAGTRLQLRLPAAVAG